MKILHIIPAYKPAYGYGGPTESVSRLCEGLVASGQVVDVFTTTANGETELDVPVAMPVNVEGVNVTYFKRITGDHTHVSPALWGKLMSSAKHYDVIHIHSWWNILVVVAAPLAIMSKAKVIVAPRGMLSEYVFTTGNSAYKRLIHAIIGRSTLRKCILHATAQAEYNECLKLIPGWKGFVLPNILSLPDIEVVENENDCFTMIFMSRIHHKKGLEKLFDAISKMPFNLKLIIAGDGDEQYIEDLKALSVELNVESKIQWMGWVNREEKFKELNKADLFVLTSFNENFANVVVESLHMGTAVLISEEVGLSDFVTENGLGWVCKLDNESIIAQLQNAYNDKEKLNFIRKNGRPIIQKSFSEKILIDKYLDVYSTFA